MHSYRFLSLLLLLGLLGCQTAAPAPAPVQVPVQTPSPTLPALPPTSTASAAATVPVVAMAELAVDVDPAGATVAVDGQVRGTSPLTLTLPAGTHRLAVSAAGFEPVSEPLTLTAGQEGMYAAVLPDVAPPTVTLTADPANVPWLGKSHLVALAEDNREVTGLQLVLNGRMLADADEGQLAFDLSPADTPGLAPGQAYTLTARALDAEGNVAQTSISLTIGAKAQAQGGGAAVVTPARPAPATATAAATSAAAPTALPQAQPEPVSYHVTSVVIPTYPYTPYLSSVVDPAEADYPVLVLDRKAYEAAQPKPVPVRYTLLVLENRFLRLTMLPELGGRIYECTFKPTGNNEFYKNPVIKPTAWGPGAPAHPAGANWWLAAGGMEWGFPVEEHGYEWAGVWGYDSIQDDDGSVVVTVFTKDYQRPYVSVSITLKPESAAFTVEPTIVNPLGEAFRFKWWESAMLAPGPANKPGADLHFIIPTGEVTVHSSGDTSLPGPGAAMSWPSYAGRDWSRLGNWTSWLGFFARPAAGAGFAGVFDTAANEGMVRVFPPDVARGVKGYAMGWSKAVDSGNWTDDGSGYVELHGGLAPTFDDWTELPPGDQVNWTETWYPVARMGGFVYASPAGALNISRTAAGARVALFPTQPVRGKLEVTLPGAAPVTLDVEAAPDRPFSQELAGSAGQGEVSVTLTDGQGQAVISYRGEMR